MNQNRYLKVGEGVFKSTWYRHMKSQWKEKENGEIDFSTYGNLT